MNVRDFQKLIEGIYGGKDRSRGTAGTYMWFCEEVGELSRALRRGSREELESEFADVFAWLATLASIHEVDLEAAALAKYAAGCPRCDTTPCVCGESRPGSATTASGGHDSQGSQDSRDCQDCQD